MDIATITKAYRRYAHVYNFYFGWIFHPGRQTALELIDTRPGRRILEVGVGTGLSLPLYPPHVKVVGIDISPEMLKFARENAEINELKYVEALEIMNAEEMTFPDNSFDSVVAMYLATVVPSPKKLVNELRRVCKPGGQIIILNHFYRPETIAGKMAGMLTPLSAYLGWRPNLSLEDFLKETGFKVDNNISVNLFSLWTILVGTNDKKA